MSACDKHASVPAIGISACPGCEIESLRKDAERYRWLRDKSESVHQFYLSTPIWFTGVKFKPETVDNAIDQAMARERT